MFSEKKLLFSWKAFGSRYFVCRIVFGCGGAGDSWASSISSIFEDFELHFQDFSEHFSRKILGFGVENPRKLMNLTMFTSPQHPNNQKLCGKRSISAQKLSTKNFFFRRNHFFAIFSTFSGSSKSKISRFGRSGDVSVPNNYTSFTPTFRFFTRPRCVLTVSAVSRRSQ